MSDLLLLCILAAIAGGINAVAGGGTLLTFPALHAALGHSAEAAVIANATSTVAIFPGAMAALGGFRRELAENRSWAILLTVPSIVGGLIGSQLVVLLDPKFFAALVPWLILLAALLFSLQPRIARWTGIGKHHASTWQGKAGAIAFQFLVALYGGYFGAGIGILMLSALAMMGMTDIHSMNALKSLLGMLINGVAALVFIISGSVNWSLALPMAVASIIGGYTTAHYSRKLDRRLVRAVVIAIGYVLAAYYFYDQFARTSRA